MDTDDLRYFVAVAELLHFRKAADRLHMTQPALSRRIKDLETCLGVQLFVRTRRDVRLTEAGTALLQDAHRLLADQAAAVQRVRDIAAGQAGILRVGFVGPAMDGPLPERIKGFKHHFPKVTLELREMSTNAQLEAVRQERLHVGFVRLVGHDLKGLETLLFLRERYVLALPDSDPLVCKEVVPLADLDDRAMIFFPRESQPMLYDAWVAGFVQAGARLRVVQNASTKHTALALTAAGVGVSIVPESSAGASRRGVVFRPLSGALPELTLHAVHPAGLQYAPLRHFLEGLPVR